MEEKALPTVVPQASGSASSEPEKTFLGYSMFTWSKIIPLGLMFFCILFNYTILRDTKVRSHMAHPTLRIPALRSAPCSKFGSQQPAIGIAGDDGGGLLGVMLE